MVEVGTVLGVAYFTALNGQVSLNGSPVPVYDNFAPDLPSNTGDFQYIVLQNIATTPENESKCNFGVSAVMTVNIVTGFLGTGGARNSRLIGDQVLKIIIPFATSAYLDFGINLQNLNTQLQTSMELVENNGTHNVYRKVYRIKHSIIQKQTA